MVYDRIRKVHRLADRLLNTDTQMGSNVIIVKSGHETKMASNVPIRKIEESDFQPWKHHWPYVQSG